MMGKDTIKLLLLVPSGFLSHNRKRIHETNGTRDVNLATDPGFYVSDTPKWSAIGLIESVALLLRIPMLLGDAKNIRRDRDDR